MGRHDRGLPEQFGNLKRVFQLVDIRHAPTEDDQLMVEYLRHYDIPFTVVATKADKLSKAQRGRSIPVICRTLGVQPWEVMVHSSKDGTGKDRLLELIEEEIAPATLKTIKDQYGLATERARMAATDK